MGSGGNAVTLVCWAPAGVCRAALTVPRAGGQGYTS